MLDRRPEPRFVGLLLAGAVAVGAAGAVSADVSPAARHFANCTALNDLPPWRRPASSGSPDVGASVVVARLEDHQVIAVEEIHQPMLVGDAPRPCPGEQVS